jgi:hypothetical protein
MKRSLLTIVLAAGSLWASSPLTGRWMGEIDGMPGVKLTIQDDQGKVSGSIVFYLIVKDEKGTHVDGDYTCGPTKRYGQGQADDVRSEASCQARQPGIWSNCEIHIRGDLGARGDDA